MNKKPPSHLNLEFFQNPKQLTSVEGVALCHVELDDYGNRSHAIPLKVNLKGNIVLDFENTLVIDFDK